MPKNNSLTQVDISQNTALMAFNCRYNQISNLDVSQNTALKFLVCNDNNISSLDISQNLNLKHYHNMSMQLYLLINEKSALIAYELQKN